MPKVSRRSLLPLFGATFLAPSMLLTRNARAEEVIGQVERVQNFAAATIGANDRILAVGDPIYLDDRVFTGADARLELTFKDQTSLTLGADAALDVDSFVFDGSGGEAGWNMLAGAFAMTTGLIGKNDPQSVVVTTPVSTIGIRGTTFWGGPVDSELYGVLILDGAVDVKTPAGTVTLDEVGEGTKINMQTGVPSDPNTWGDGLVAQAMASITFVND